MFINISGTKNLSLKIFSFEFWRYLSKLFSYHKLPPTWGQFPQMTMIFNLMSVIFNTTFFCLYFNLYLFPFFAFLWVFLVLVEGQKQSDRSYHYWSRFHFYWLSFSIHVAIFLTYIFRKKNIYTIFRQKWLQFLRVPLLWQRLEVLPFNEAFRLHFPGLL